TFGQRGSRFLRNPREVPDITRSRCSSAAFVSAAVTPGPSELPRCGVQALWTDDGPRDDDGPRSSRGPSVLQRQVGELRLLVLGDVEVRELLGEAGVRATRADVL